MLRIRELIAASAILACTACADTNSVVGGACATGYVEQGNACVPSTSVGGDGGIVNDGDGGPSPNGDASRPSDDASAQGDSSSTTSDATTSDASTSDAGDPTATIGQGFFCVPPEIKCGDVCVDPTSDPDNCGSCGHVCPSNSCVASKCVGSAPGHVVVIGHDYAIAPSTFSSQARVLTNATLIPASNPLRVMSYDEFADATSVANAEGVVNAEAKQLGRSVTFVSTSSSQTVSSTIDVNSYEVLLVHDQKKAPQGALGTIGSSWQSSGTIATFLHAGGVVIVLSGGTGTAEMPSLATNASLLTVNSQSTITGSLSVLAPADAVGSGVISPYVPKANTVSFDTESNGGNVVWVVAQNGAPVVVHKIMP